MRLKLALIFIILLLSSIAYGAYTIKIDPDLDYYETSGVTPNQPYQSTLSGIIQVLIDSGIMQEAPAVQESSGGQHFSKTYGYHFDRTEGTHFDR